MKIPLSYFLLQNNQILNLVYLFVFLKSKNIECRKTSYENTKFRNYDIFNSTGKLN